MWWLQCRLLFVVISCFRSTLWRCAEWTCYHFNITAKDSSTSANSTSLFLELLFFWTLTHLKLLHFSLTRSNAVLMRQSFCSTTFFISFQSFVLCVAVLALISPLFITYKQLNWSNDFHQMISVTLWCAQGKCFSRFMRWLLLFMYRLNLPFLVQYE